MAREVTKQTDRISEAEREIAKLAVSQRNTSETVDRLAATVQEGFNKLGTKVDQLADRQVQQSSPQWQTIIAALGLLLFMVPLVGACVGWYVSGQVVPVQKDTAHMTQLLQDNSASIKSLERGQARDEYWRELWERGLLHDPAGEVILAPRSSFNANASR